MPPSSASPIVAECGGAIAVGQAAAASPTRRIRLLLLTDTSTALPGGSERFLRNLVGLLPGDRYDITLVQLADDRHVGDGTHPPPAAAHVCVLDMPVGAIYAPKGWRVLAALRRLLREQRFDVVQSHHEKSDLLNALLPRRAGCVHLSNRRDMGYKKSARLKRLFRLLNHRFDSVIAPSQPILTELVRSEAIDPARLLWIPNGVDTQRFRPHAAAARTLMRQSLGLDDDAIALVCVARLSAEKRHVDLIDAFALLHARLPRTRLFLIGAGPLQADVEARSSAHGLAGAVTLLGTRPDVESVLPAMDIGLLTSATEGMSNAILEMMACGLPVIATAVGGNPAVVDDGVTGVLVPALDPARLADAMGTLAQSMSMRSRLGAAGRARIEREFSLAAMVGSFDQTYRRMLEA